MRVALVHDYLAQRGGAERVVLSMLKAFPGAPLHTSLYEPGSTYWGLRRLQRTTWDPRAPVAHASIFVEACFVEALRATSFAAATGSGPRELYGSAR